jgi:RNA polymerase sigma-70 factor (ECF subfamily)
MQIIPKELLIQASEGDIQAFENIYSQTADFVYTVAFRITNNREDAEDVTQEVFLKIYKNLKKFQFRSSFKTWLYRITVNTAINTYRRVSKILRKKTNYDIAIKTQASIEPAQTVIEKEQKEVLLKSLLDLLNPDQRACLILREVEQLSYEEIAQILKININTVRSRLRRARQILLAFSQKKKGEKDEL